MRHYVKSLKKFKSRPVKLTAQTHIKHSHPNPQKTHLVTPKARPAATRQEMKKDLLLPIAPLGKGTGKTPKQMMGTQLK